MSEAPPLPVRPNHAHQHSPRPHRSAIATPLATPRVEKRVTPQWGEWLKGVALTSSQAVRR